MKTIKAGILPVILFVFIFSACKKDNNSGNKTQPTTEASTSFQISSADEQMNDGLSNALDAADGNEDGNINFRLEGCVTVTRDTVNKIITIDFGSGCVNPYTGRTRSGVIKIGYVGINYAYATERTFQFINYQSVDTITLNGTLTMNNIGYANNVLSFTLTTSGFEFAFTDGTKHTITSFTRNYSIDLGSNIQSISDNVTSITGNNTGINREGESYSVEIVSPVKIYGECTQQHIFYPAMGEYKVTIGSKPEFDISWGTGSCDKEISVTVLGVTKTYTLK